MAALESTSVQAVLETPSELDAPGAEEGAVNPLSVEDKQQVGRTLHPDVCAP